MIRSKSRLDGGARPYGLSEADWVTRASRPGRRNGDVNGLGACCTAYGEEADTDDADTGRWSSRGDDAVTTRSMGDKLLGIGVDVAEGDWC